MQGEPLEHKTVLQLGKVGLNQVHFGHASERVPPFNEGTQTLHCPGHKHPFRGPIRQFIPVAAFSCTFMRTACGQRSIPGFHSTIDFPVHSAHFLWATLWNCTWERSGVGIIHEQGRKNKEPWASERGNVCKEHHRSSTRKVVDHLHPALTCIRWDWRVMGTATGHCRFQKLCH
jgi:hypothetical protein